MNSLLKTIKRFFVFFLLANSAMNWAMNVDLEEGPPINYRTCVLDRVYGDNCADTINVPVHGKSLLYCAAQEGKLDAVEWFVSHRADINWTCLEDNTTPLFAALEQEHPEVVAYLYPLGAFLLTSLKAKHNRSTLYMAAAVGNQGLVEDLVNQYNANINEQDDFGRTPLWAAARNGHANIVYFLASRGALIDQADADGNTPLFMALDHAGSKEVVACLINNGANVHARASRYDLRKRLSPLDMAVQKCRPEIVQMLHTKGAQLNAYKNTPHYKGILEKWLSLGQNSSF